MKALRCKMIGFSLQENFRGHVESVGRTKALSTFEERLSSFMWIHLRLKNVTRAIPDKYVFVFSD